jgi:hypothetical protein
MNPSAVDPSVWTIAKWEFSAFVAERTGLPQPVVMRTQIGTMNQELVEADVDGLSVRLVCDRGTMFVDILVAGDWRSARLLLDFAAGRSADSPVTQDVAPRDVWARWPDIRKVAGDHVGLQQFQDAADTAAIARFNALANRDFAASDGLHPEPSMHTPTLFERMMRLSRPQVTSDSKPIEPVARPAPGKRSSTG